MKLTHSTGIKTRQRRTDDEGFLVDIETKTNETSKVFDDLNKQYIEKFILIPKEKNHVKNEQKRILLITILTNILDDKFEDFKKNEMFIRKNFDEKYTNKHFDKNFKDKMLSVMSKGISEEKNNEITLLKEIIKNINQNNEYKDLFTKLSFTLNNRKNKKLNSLKKSVEKNKIRFILEGENFVTDQTRTEIIYDLLKDFNQIDTLIESMVPEHYHEEVFKIIKKCNPDKYKVKVKSNVNHKSEIISEFKEIDYKFRKNNAADNKKLFYLEESRTVFLKIIDKNSYKLKSIDIIRFQDMILKEIKNKVINLNLEIGKVIFNEPEKTDKIVVDSNKLEEIKIKESVNKSLYELVTDINHRLHHLYELEKYDFIVNDGDITTNEAKKIAYQNKNQTIHNFNELLFEYPKEIKESFNSLFSENSAPLLKELSTMRNSTYHYKGDKLHKVFKSDEPNQEQLIYKQIFDYDNNNIGNKLKEKFRSMRLLDFFSLNYINGILKQIKLSLSKEVYAFAPSFNSVYKKLEINEKKEFVTEEEKNALFSFLKIIYYYGFMTSDKKDIYLRTSKEAQEITKDQNFRRILNEIPYNNAKQYFSDIQSVLMRTSVNTDKNQKTFNDYIINIYKDAFDSYLKSELGKTIDDILKNMNYTTVTEQEIYNNIDIEVVNTTNVNINYSFYMFFKLASSSTLNNFKGNINKYIQYQEKSETDSKINEFNDLLYAIELAIISKPITSEYFNNKEGTIKENLQAKLKEIGIDMLRYREYYYNNSESEVKYLRHGIPLINYKNYSLLKSIKDDTEKRIEKNFSNIRENEKNIQELQKQRKELHKYIIDKKDKKDTARISQFKTIVKEIDDYHNVHDLLSFLTYKKAVALLNDIRRKVLEYLFMYERDIIYSMATQNFIHNKKKSYRLKKSNAIEELTGSPYRNEVNLLLDSKKIIENSEERSFRDNISHHNYKKQYTIQEYLDYTRSIIGYDRKLKNSVFKSFNEIFQEYGLYLDSKIEKKNNKHAIIITDIKIYENIEYFKNMNLKKKLKSTTANNNLVEIVKKILYYK